MDGQRAGISERKRALPVRNLRNGADDKSAPRCDLSWAANELSQFEMMLELEDMENDRASAGILAYGPDI